MTQLKADFRYLSDAHRGHAISQVLYFEALRSRRGNCEDINAECVPASLSEFRDLIIGSQAGKKRGDIVWPAAQCCHGFARLLEQQDGCIFAVKDFLSSAKHH